MKFNKSIFNKTRIKCFSKTFTISVVIIFFMVSGCWYLSEYLDSRTTTEIDFPIGMEIEDYDEYMEKQKDVASDISGMSIYDKYVMGLQIQDGSDSDYDGLSDKEEIEIYGTDPLAASTAGDLYTDGYKVEQGLDLFTYKEYEEEQVFRYIECPEVQVTAKVPTDFNTVVEDYTDVYSLEKYGIKEIYKGYCFYNYSGNISIDTSEILEKNNIELNKLNVYVADDLFLVNGMTELTKCSYAAEGNVISLNYEFDGDKQYLIYITDKKQFKFNAMLENIAGRFIQKKDDSEKDEFTGIGIIYGSPLLDQFFGIGLKGYYGECDSEEKTHMFFDVFSKYCNTYKGMSISNANIHEATPMQIKAKQNMLDAIFSFFELPMDNYSTSRLRNAFFIYTKYEAVCNAETAVIEVSTSNAQGKFNKDIDELPFQNFESYIAEGGNCAGISHLTSYLYNTKTLPKTGAYNCTINGEQQTIEWALFDDKENETLCNPGLSDYKTKDFIDNLSGKDDNYIRNGLTDGEKQFVNMVGCFWAEGNDKIDNSYMLPSGTLEEYSVLESMMDYLDQGKILDVYLYMCYGGGHAVNIYGYQHTQFKDQTIFFIYDSNIPGDSRSGFKVDMTNGTCILQTIKVHDKGGKDKFVFLYYPMKNNRYYLATNRAGQQQYHMIVAMDENWNVIH